MNKNDLQRLFEAKGLPLSRLLGSKSRYLSKNENNIVFFNANVITKSCHKVWFGDIDLNKDWKKLCAISKAASETLYVLSEFKCRFDTEKKTTKALIATADWSTKEGAPPTKKEWVKRCTVNAGKLNPKK